VFVPIGRSGVTRPPGYEPPRATSGPTDPVEMSEPGDQPAVSRHESMAEPLGECHVDHLVDRPVVVSPGQLPGAVPISGRVGDPHRQVCQMLSITSMRIMSPPCCPVHRVEDLVGGVDPDQIHQGQRAHRQPAASRIAASMSSLVAYGVRRSARQVEHSRC